MFFLRERRTKDSCKLNSLFSLVFLLFISHAITFIVSAKKEKCEIIMGRGKLVFKGEEKAKKRKKDGGGSRGVKSGPVEHGGGGIGDAPDDAHAARATAAADDAGSASPAREGANVDDDGGGRGGGPPAVSIGRGTIMTSSNVVTGHGTSFQSELRAGDAILASTSANGNDEMRVITMILSNASASISSAFSSDLSVPTAFRYVRRPRDDARDGARRAARDRLEREEVERRAMGTYGDKDEVVYREKTEHGGYRIRREKMTTDMTRSDLLSVREKKKSDRYC